MNARQLVAVLLLGSAFTGCGPEPDAEIEGGGVIAEGWNARPDKAAAGTRHVRFTEQGGVFELTLGPNVILYRKDQAAKGAYKLSVRVEHLDPGDHPHGAGLIFGGKNLDKDNQVYTYFLVRGDGKYIVKTRDGDKTNDLSEKWAESAALNKGDDKGRCSNVLEVEVGKERTLFRVNGKQLFEHATESLHAEGVYGFRANHNQKLRFHDLAVSAGS